jgi:hypothetical protein
MSFSGKGACVEKGKEMKHSKQVFMVALVAAFVLNGCSFLDKVLGTLPDLTDSTVTIVTTGSVPGITVQLADAGNTAVTSSFAVVVASTQSPSLSAQLRTSA